MSSETAPSEAPARLDRPTLEALYLRLEVSLYNVVYRWLWDAQDAQEVVQEAFVRLWRMRDRVDLRTVEPLVYKIAVNQAATRRRARQRWGWVSLDRTAPPRARGNPAEEVARAEVSEAVREAVDALPDKQRAVVLLCEFSGLSYREVAEILDIPEGTVGSRRNTSLRALRASLEAHHER